MHREVLRALSGAPTVAMSTLNKDFMEELLVMVRSEFVLTACASGDFS
jgi:hypothetical protein